MGALEGFEVGLVEGLVEGFKVGFVEGLLECSLVGDPEGLFEGTLLGLSKALEEGSSEENLVGPSVGLSLGLSTLTIGAEIVEPFDGPTKDPFDGPTTDPFDGPTPDDPFANGPLIPTLFLPFIQPLGNLFQTPTLPPF